MMRCPKCGSIHFDMVYDFTQPEHTTPAKYRLKCSKCGEYVPEGVL